METETQVAKIKIGNEKQTNTFVSILAENSSFSQAEAYMVMELPLFNPAAIPDCERITKSVAAAFRRSFKGEVTDLTFENALSEINEELAKLVNIGQDNWVGKLGAILAVKIDDLLYCATTGKIIAMMLRDGELINLADSPKKPNPEKTFENFATGKIQLGDIFLFSTTNLFNYVSVDRFKQMAFSNSVLPLAHQLTRILEDQAGPEMGFGTLIVYQVEPGTPITPVAEPSLPQHFLEKQPSMALLEQKLTEDLNKINSSFFISIRDFVINFFSKKESKKSNSKNLFSNRLTNLSTRTKEFVNSAKVKYTSKQKKFFLISAVVLLLALFVNIGLTKFYSKNTEQKPTTSSNIQDLSNLLNNAEKSAYAGDKNLAISLLQEFENKVRDFKDQKPSDTEKIVEFQKQKSQITNLIDKSLKINPVELASFEEATTLITTPTSLIVTKKNNEIQSFSYNGDILEKNYSCPDRILAGNYLKDNTLIAYNSQNLLICNLTTNTSSGQTTGLVPAEHEFGGMAFYPTNNRLYTINISTGQIISFNISPTGPEKPTIWTQDESLKQQTSLTIDGSLYTYGRSGIKKYLSGKPDTLTQPELFTPLSGQGKIYTQKEFQQIYILDSGNNRVVILSKTGELISTITSEKILNPIDFSVNEKTKTIFILTPEKLWKIDY